MSGDAQIANPGAAVAVKPVVSVKNAAGVAIAGVSVTFTVDSGSGSLQSTSTTTAADGTASPGEWRLGAAEGRNVITARVSSLPPLKFVATAFVASVSVAGQNVPTSGGVVTLTHPGSALNGTTFTIPSGALVAPGTIGFTISSATAVTLPAGMAAVTPALTITGPTGALKKPATLRLTSVAPAGKIMLVLAQDATTGAFTILPSSSSTASAVTVSLGSIDAAAAATASGALVSSLRAPSQPIIIGVAFDPALLAPDFDSNFRPGTDDWDFQRQLISSFPDNGAVDPASSMVSTSLWYFVNRKGLSGKLYEKYQEVAAIPESNRRGLRWASVAYQGIPDLYAQGGLAETTRSGYNASPATQAQQEMYEIKAAFLLSSNKPQPIFVFTINNAVVDSEPRYGTAYRTVGNAIDLAIPDAPGRTFRITLSPTGWQPVSVTTIGGVTYSVNFVAPIQYAILVRDAALAPQFPLVTSGTIGDAQGWPKVTLHSAYGALDTAKVYLLDALQHWWECDACADHGYRAAQINPSPTKVILHRRATQNTDLSWNVLEATQFGSASYSDNVFAAGRTSRTVASALYQPGAGSSTGNAVHAAWLDWIRVTYKKLPVDVLADSVWTFGDTTVAYTATVTGAPSGSSYRWTYKGKVTDSTDTTVPNFSRRMTEPGRWKMYGTVLEGIKKRPIGGDSSAVIYANGWQFQSAALASAILPPGGIGSAHSDTLGLQLITQWSADLQTTPANSLIFLGPGPNCRTVVLEQFPNGQIVDTLSQAGFRALLGSDCNFTPDLITTFTMGRPGQGTVVGNATATDADPDQITIPGGSISATMNGSSLQGTLVWKFRFTTGIALYTFTFQARVRTPP